MWTSVNKIVFHGTVTAVCNRPVRLNQTLFTEEFHMSLMSLTQFDMCTSIYLLRFDPCHLRQNT